MVEVLSQDRVIIDNSEPIDKNVRRILDRVDEE